MKAGCWVLVCGPSGAGKDSVLGWAADALAHDARVVFARRWVTRSAASAGCDDEISAAAMARRRADGGFAWYWEAHGLAYGVDALHGGDVAAGRIVAVNGSRAHAAAVGARPDVRRVLVTAPRELLAQRLAQRGREPAEAVAQRLSRSDAPAVLPWHLEIVNDGDLATAGLHLAAYLKELTR